MNNPISAKEPDPRHELELSVRWSETGPGGWLKPPAWLDYCMEAADAGARRLGFSMTDVAALGYYWVMSRYRLAFTGTPQARDGIRIRTWARGYDRLFALREYEFTDANGHSLGCGTTGWLLVKKENFRPVRPAEHLPPLPTAPEYACCEKVSPLRPTAEFGERPFTLTVRHDEIDLLGHVSNPHYIRWAIEALPLEVRQGHRLMRLDVDFLGMAFAGDAIEVFTASHADAGPARGFEQVIRKAGSDRDLTRLRTRWAPNPATAAD